ncbi:hypothetical protein [Halomicronema hongdechloris]|uniref:hypothetical protein n=1 Tax=Halomicronema hongdechloris TaxID=1209493 RepID=UPI0016513B7A|nr:hypothetical protein [Halomicronema hongdechloris]
MTDGSGIYHTGKNIDGGVAEGPPGGTAMTHIELLDFADENPAKRLQQIAMNS